MAGCCTKCGEPTTNTRGASLLGLCFCCEFDIPRKETVTEPLRDSAEIAARKFEEYYSEVQPQWTLGEVHVEKLANIIREECL